MGGNSVSSDYNDIGGMNADSSIIEVANISNDWGEVEVWEKVQGHWEGVCHGNTSVSSPNWLNQGSLTLTPDIANSFLKVMGVNGIVVKLVGSQSSLNCILSAATSINGNRKEKGEKKLEKHD